MHHKSNCESCIYNDNGVCLEGKHFGRTNCWYYQKKKNIFEKIFPRINEFFKMILTILVSCSLIFSFLYVQYIWTKNSLEDLTGKKVKPSTVLWTMFITSKSSK